MAVIRRKTPCLFQRSEVRTRRPVDMVERLHPTLRPVQRTAFQAMKLHPSIHPYIHLFSGFGGQEVNCRGHQFIARPHRGTHKDTQPFTPTHTLTWVPTSRHVRTSCEAAALTAALPHHCWGCICHDRVITLKLQPVTQPANTVLAFWNHQT